MANLELPFGVKPINPLSNLDKARYGAHATVQDALDATAGTREIGLTVLIVDTEYWFKDGIADGDLVIKVPEVVVPTNTSDLTNDGSDGTSTYVENDEIGTAAANNTEDFATASQGDLADTSIQPGDNLSTLNDDIGILTETEAAATYQPIFTLEDDLFIDEDGNLRSNISDFKEEFIFNTGDSQIITLAFNYTYVLSVSVDSTPLHKSQYNLILPNQIEILDTIDDQDPIIILYQHYINEPV